MHEMLFILFTIRVFQIKQLYLISAPSAPRAVTTTGLTETSTTVNWEPPEDINGELEYYIIRWKLSELPEYPEGQNKTEWPNKTETIVPGLVSCEFYNFSVSGFTVEEGNASEIQGSVPGTGIISFFSNFQ